MAAVANSYPIAGWIGATAGIGAAFATTAGTALLACVAALRLWPGHDPEHLWHRHEEFEHSHPHGSDEHHTHVHGPRPTPADAPEPHAHDHRHESLGHSHRFVIDAHHPRWPSPDDA